MVTEKPTTKLKRQIDGRFKDVFNELKDNGAVSSMLEFASKLDVTEARNIHSIFRSAEGFTTSIRHVNEKLVLALQREYHVNSNFILYGSEPKFLKPMKSKKVVEQKFDSPLQAIRIIFGLTQKELGDKIGKEQSHVSMMEKRGMPLDVIKELHKKMNIPYEFMIDFNGDASELYKLKNK